MRGKTYDREYLVNKVAYMRMEGKSTYNLIEFLKNDIGMGQTTAYEILREAQQVIVELQTKDIESSFADAVGRLECLYDNTKDKKLMLEIQKEISKLKGLYSAQKIDITSGGDKLEGFKIIFPEEEKKKDDK